MADLERKTEQFFNKPIGQQGRGQQQLPKAQPRPRLWDLLLARLLVKKEIKPRAERDLDDVVLNFPWKMMFEDAPRGLLAQIGPWVGAILSFIILLIVIFKK